MTNCRFLKAFALSAGFLVFAPFALAQQPASTPDAPHPMRQVRFDRDPSGPGPGEMPGGFDHREMGMHHGHDKGFGMPHGEWWRNPEAVKRLGLTPEQTKRLDELSIKGKLEEIHLRASLEEDEVLLKPMLSSPTFDEKKTTLQIDKVVDAHAALEKAKAKNMVELRAVLTTDQWTKMHNHEGHGMEPNGERGPNGMHHEHRPEAPPAPGAAS